MKILIASDTYHPHVNGASYFTQRLAHALLHAGHDVAVVAPSTSIAHESKNHDGVRFYGISSIPVFFVPEFRFVIPLIINRRIRSALKEFRPDIVHIQMHFPIARATLREAEKLNIPLVATNHFMPENLTHYLHLPKGITNLLHALAWKDAVRIYRRTRRVTAPTRTAAAMLRPWMQDEIPAVSNGIDLNRFNPHNDPSPAKQKYNLPKKPILLFVGRLDKEKNVDVVLRATALAQSDFHLVIAGHGAEAEKLKRLARSLGISRSVTFTGFVPDELLPSLYAAADCFVNAGIAELQCIAAMEAMASGLPVIGAGAVALPELIHDRENGFLFEPGNSEELAKKIEGVMNNEELRKQMGEQSLEFIAKHDINLTIEAFDEIYRKALASSSVVH